MIDLGTLGGGSSCAYRINDSGALVRYSWLAGGNDTHTFLDSGGVMQDLNSRLEPGSGWELLTAYGINDLGQITGAGLFNGTPKVFLLDPNDIPVNLAADVRAVPQPGHIPGEVVDLAVAAGRQTPLLRASSNPCVRVAHRQTRLTRRALARIPAKQPVLHPGGQVGQLAGGGSRYNSPDCRNHRLSLEHHFSTHPQ
jgi:hypothetical protein